jgi:hypothetical protein
VVVEEEEEEEEAVVEEEEEEEAVEEEEEEEATGDGAAIGLPHLPHGVSSLVPSSFDMQVGACAHTGTRVESVPLALN